MISKAGVCLSQSDSDLPVDTTRQEEKMKTATIMEEPSDGLHEKQKHGRRYGRRQTSGNEQTALSCVDPDDDDDDDRKF